MRDLAADIFGLRIATVLVAAMLSSIIPFADLSAQTPAVVYDLQDYLASIRKGEPQMQLGVQVSRVEDGKLVFGEGEDEKLVPASVLKLLTTYASLKYLGPGYRFPTEIFLTHLPRDLAVPDSPQVDFAEPKSSVRNLYIRGYGDPTMDSNSLRVLSDSLPRLGVKEVDDVVLDDTLFVDPPRASGDKAHEAGLNAFTLNYNTFALFVAPGALGQPAVVSLTEGVSYNLINRVRTARSSLVEIVVNLQPSANVSFAGSDEPEREFFSSPTKFSVTAQGTIGNRRAGAPFFFAAPDLSGYFASVLRHSLAKSGVTVKGKFRRGEVPAAAKLLQTSESAELAEIVRTVNHLSSNVMAGQLAYALGQDPGGYFRYDRGLDRLRSTLESFGEAPDSFSIVDASGLDRENRIKVSQLIKILVTAYQDFSLGPDFVASLSRFGQIGTLKDRELLEPQYLGTLRGEDLEEAKHRASTVRAKTGTLDGVSSLAGYAQLKTGERVAFAIISNGIADKNEAVAIENAIVRILLGFPGEYRPTAAVPKVAPPGTIEAVPIQSPVPTPERENRERPIGDSPAPGVVDRPASSSMGEEW